MPKCITPSSSQIMSPAHKVLEDFKVPSFSLHVSLTSASFRSNELQRSLFETSGRNRAKDACDSNTCLPISLYLTRMHKSTDFLSSSCGAALP
uniref:Uncharacterized protein n=1 Tax=Glossina palpalis gambiensis TaxID=67801 RepID=A0A1B0AKN7_9MUSC